MDVRVLRYFLAVARLESITGAAEYLHMSQPPLSRQLMELEQELGKKLLIRGSRKVRLTEEGMILRRRAEEIIDLMEKTQSEIMLSGEDVSGYICVGGGETQGMRLVAGILKSMRDDYPNVKIHLYSGNAEDVAERLERGRLDFGLLVGPTDLTQYDFIRLPAVDHWGVLMRRDSPLAAQESVAPRDLLGLPLLCSMQNMVENEISGWMGVDYEKLNIIARYNLLFNASLLVEAGVGCALCLDGLMNLTPDGPLCFRPLAPALEVNQVLAWKKYHVFSRPARKFIERLTEGRVSVPMVPELTLSDEF